MNPDDLTWCNLPNGEPGIVVWYWNELGERINDPMFAIGIVAADRFRKFHSFKIDDKTFEEVMLQ